MKRYRLFVKFSKDPDSKAWTEDYNLEDESEAEAMIERFNATLRPAENPRTLVKVEEIGEPDKIPHEWDKTNLVTLALVPGGGNYDTVKCSACGITGRRYGLGLSGIRRDKKYNAKKWDYCKP